VVALKHSEVKTARDTSVLCIRLACALLVCGSAQAEGPRSPTGDLSGDRASLSEVVVTGSRIPVNANDETFPVTLLDSTDLARGGLNSLSAIIQTLPMSATSVLNTNVNNNGDGSARLDLRALQPKRTLVLLNGHRFPNGGIGGDSAVDLNSLPVSLIDRVEVLTSGASAIYGADAVAGVVNFITRSKFEGVELGGEQSQTDRGDGRISRLTLSAGHDFFGGQWILGGEYVDQRPVYQTARNYSAVPVVIDNVNGETIPSGSFTLPEGLFFFVPAGNALGLAPDFYTHVTGTIGRTAADFRPANFNSDVYNYAPYNFLQTPNERGSVWLLGSQPLAPNVSFHLEGLFSHRRSSQLVAPTPYASDGDPAPLLADGTRGIPAANYYNPFGEDLTVYRRFTELGDRVNRQRVEMNRELAALNIQLGSWKIEPAASFSRSNASETDIGYIPGQRLATAVGPSGPDAQGHIVCGSPDATGVVPAAAIIPGCVPIDLFDGVGSLTQQQLTYLNHTLEDHGSNSERFASLNAQGPWGSAPGGPIQWAAGVEYRREEASYTFDPNRGGGVVGSGGQNDVPNVSFSAREVYLETRAPLARQRPFAQAVDASAGLRYSNFSSFGGHFTWQAGLRWQPFESWTFRTNYARVFRAPDLRELYLSQGTGFSGTADPCGNSPTAIERVHCAASGVPGGQYVQGQNSYFIVLQGGNPTLAPESGYSFDIGIDLRPPAFPNVRASLDYYQINLDDYIDVPGAGDILQQCADAGRADICSLIRRAADGRVISLSTIPRNFGNVVVSGIDTSVSASTERSAGRLTLSVRASYLRRHDAQLFHGGDTVREAGTYSSYASALPHWRSLAHVDFDRGPWHLSYSNQWIGGYTECGLVFFIEGRYCRSVEGVFYHDVEAALTIRTSLTLRLGVTNLTDRQPPFLDFGTDANTDTSIYRLLGRTFFAGVRYRLH
jgi:iron complex outermembrane receptor protein